jgi:signal transduction histidine kinase
VHQRERSIAQGEATRLRALTHELRNQLYAATLAFDMLKMGHAGIGGSTAGLLGRSLHRMDELVTRALAVVRLESPIRKPDRIALSELVDEVVVDASLEAVARGLALRVAPTERGVDVEGDRQILAGAIANLLESAFERSRAGGAVSLGTQVTVDRVLIEIEDACGGLPAGKIEELSRPLAERGDDGSEPGLGLSASRRAVEASGGVIRVRDLPGTGCVFTVDLPRSPISRVFP